LAIVVPDDLEYYVDKTTDRSPNEEGRKLHYVTVLACCIVSFYVSSTFL